MSTSLKDYQQVRGLAIQSLFEIIEQSSEGTVIVDRDANIVWMNERYAKRFGLKSADQAIGQPCEQVISNSLLRQVVRNDRPILLDIQDTPKGPLVVMRLPIHDEAGAVIGAIGFALFDELRNLSPLIERYLSMQQELASTRSLLRSRQSKYNFAHFIGTSAASLEVKRRARRSASAESPVLLLGETGTGKELLAQAIHGASPRAHKAFVSINSAAIPHDLLEAEFFGTAPGAFTGADRKGRPGKFQIAQGGTLFLDEIGDMPADTQTRLLRVLADGEFYRVGGHVPVKVDVRIIAATHQNLETLVHAGKFREDLFHRLNVIRIHIPRLSDRREDIPTLARHFLSRAAQELAVEPKLLKSETEEYLKNLPWPGNVRQLENTCRWITVMASGREVHISDLPPELLNLPQDSAPVTNWEQALRQWADQALARGQSSLLDSAVPAFERIMIETALKHTAGRRRDAAVLLGWGRNTLTRKIKELGMKVDGGDDEEGEEVNA